MNTKSFGAILVPVLQVLALTHLLPSSVCAAETKDRSSVFRTECQARMLMTTWELYPDRIPQQAETRKEAVHACDLLVDHINKPEKIKFSPVYWGCFYGIQIVISDKPMDERQVLTTKLMKEHCKL